MLWSHLPLKGDHNSLVGTEILGIAYITDNDLILLFDILLVLLFLLIFTTQVRSVPQPYQHILFSEKEYIYT